MAKPARGGNWLLIGAVGLVAALGYYGFTGHQKLAALQEQQRRSTADYLRWVNVQLALKPFDKQFLASIPEATEIRDIYSLSATIGLEKYGLTSRVEDMAVDKTDSLKVNGKEVGATKVCLLSSGVSGLQVKAKDGDTAKLLTAVDKLLAAKHVTSRGVTVRTDANGTTATLINFCILLRGKTPV